VWHANNYCTRCGSRPRRGLARATSHRGPPCMLPARHTNQDSLEIGAHPAHAPPPSLCMHGPRGEAVARRRATASQPPRRPSASAPPLSLRVSPQSLRRPWAMVVTFACGGAGTDIWLILVGEALGSQRPVAVAVVFGADPNHRSSVVALLLLLLHRVGSRAALAGCPSGRRLYRLALGLRRVRQIAQLHLGGPLERACLNVRVA